MSKRFGRNQRRRARESIAELEQKNAALTSGMAMDRGLLRHQSEQLADLRKQIAEAQKILGPYHVAFPAEDYVLGGKPRTPVGLPVMPRFSDNPFPSNPEIMPSPIMIEHKLLSVLGLHVYEDEINMMRHVNVRFDGGSWGYAIDRATAATTPRDILIERIAIALAALIAEELAPLGKSRRSA